MQRWMVICAFLLMVSTPVAKACDLCAIYMAQEAAGAHLGFSAGLAGQFTRFDTLLDDGDRVGNQSRESMDSVIVQGVLRYQFTHRLGVQVNVPYIDRSFEREGDHDSESGLGDISVIAIGRIVEQLREESTLILNLFAGIKTPTGSSDRLREEGDAHHAEEPGGHDHDHGHGFLRVGHAGHDHGAPPSSESVSGLHAHDIALGSGSWDVLSGASLYARRGRWFTQAAMQYSLRTEGDHDYEFGDDVMWSLAPGWYARMDHRGTVGLGAHLSGEMKDEDERDGHTETGTEVTLVYAGPMLTFTREDRLSAEFAVDLPVYQDSEGVALVPDYRIRLAGAWRF
jgi:hypothetical protein